MAGNKILVPILERRLGKLIPSHRWMAPKSSVSHEDRLRRLSLEAGWPGSSLVPSRIREIGEKLLGARWKAVEESVDYRVVWGGFSSIGPYARGNTIVIPKSVPIWSRLLGAKGWTEYVRRIAPYIPRGAELEAVVLHELIHVYEHLHETFGKGKEFLEEVGGIPHGEAKLAEKGLWGLYRLKALAQIDPDEILPVLVELALYSPHELEIYRRMALGRGVDLYSAAKKHWGVDLFQIKAPHDEGKVRALMMLLGGGNNG